jgi:hypothetical protein
MPTLSRAFVRSALLCLGIGFTLGGYLLAAKAGRVSPEVWRWLPPHIVLLLFGWLGQLTLGVAYWILPRIEAGERGRPCWAWSSLVACQAGVIFIVLSMLLGRALLALGALALAGGMTLFAVHAWPRLKPILIRGRVY